MADSSLDIYRRKALETGIGTGDWRPTEAFVEFVGFFNGTYTEEQRQLMKYDAILEVFQIWWSEHHSKYG